MAIMERPCHCCCQKSRARRDVAAPSCGIFAVAVAALRAGVDSIEHGTFMTDEVIQLMLEKGTYWVPTNMAGEWVAKKAEEPGYFPEIVRPKAAEIGPAIRETFRKAHAAGVKIGVSARMNP